MKEFSAVVRAGMVFAAAGLFVAISAQRAQATTISGALTADNAFFAYIGTSDTSLGTLVAEGNNWGSAVTFSNFALTPGQTYYLEIEAINYGGPGALLGQFSLSDSGFEFANSTQTLLTNTTDWLASYNDTNSDPSSPQPWVTPTGGVISDGNNGVAPWNTISGISGSATWIDAAVNGLGSCQYCTVDFSATIIPTASSVPEPGTLGFVLGGLSIGLLRVRRTRVTGA